MADNNIPRSVVKHLKKLGYDVIRVSRFGRGITDEEVVKLAQEEMRVILTFDRDFGELVIKRGLRPPGVIILEFEPKSSAQILEEILDLLESDVKFYGHLTVFDGLRIRQRKI